jgi:hypothetical protein
MDGGRFNDLTTKGAVKLPNEHVPHMPLDTIDTRPDLVTVGFEGLGVCCFAKEKILGFDSTGLGNATSTKRIAKPSPKTLPTIPARGEIGVIREANHSFTIEVQENSGGTIVLPKIVLPSDGVEIVIKATMAPQILAYAKYEPPAQLAKASLGAQDLHDLDWIIDIDAIHGVPLIPKNGSPTKLSTIYIHNAEFYTRRFLLSQPSASGSVTPPPPQLQILKKQGSSQAESLFVGHELGAKIPAKSAQLLIKVKGVITHQLQMDDADGKTYFISMKNTCINTNSNISDFGSIYKFLQASDGSTFSLEPASAPIKPVPTSGGQSSQTKNVVAKQVPNPQQPTDLRGIVKTYVRFCGAYTASGQDGISAILAAQSS